MRNKLCLFLAVLILCMLFSVPASAETTAENYTVTIPTNLTMASNSQNTAVKISGSIPMSSVVQVSLHSSSNFHLRNSSSTVKYGVYLNGTVINSGDVILRANSQEVASSKTALLSFQILGTPHTSGRYSDTVTFRISTIANPLVSIAVTTPPSKTVYNHGDSFDKTGMVVTAYYKDGSSQPVTGYTVIDGVNMPKGKTMVTVSYTEGGITKTATTPVTVKNPLSSITVTTMPNTNSYAVGDTFNSTGMVLTAQYLDGSTKAVTDYTILDGVNLPTGKASVTISYTEDGITKTTDVPITVVNQLTGITVTTPPNKTVYNHGDSFDKAGMVVTAYYKDGSSKTVTSYTVTDGVNMPKGKTMVTVSYTEGGVTKTATTPVTVNNPLASISITASPDKSSYTVGENFDPTGMVVTAQYLDGSTKTITDYTVTDGSSLPMGKTSVSISYSEGGVSKTASVPINVSNPLTSISVTTPPTKTAYIAGEVFDYTGMVVTARYSDGSTKAVTNYTVTDGGSLGRTQTSVSISYSEGGVTKTASTPISVTNPLVGIYVTTAPNKTVYTLGENFDSTGMVITAAYADGSSKTVTVYSITNGSNFGFDSASVTVSYTEDGVTKTATVPISVVNPLTGITVTTPPNKTSYIAGETFDYSGMVVTATYANGSSKVVSSYSITDGYSLSVGQNNVTISYTENGVTKTANTPISVTNSLVGIAVTTPPNKTSYTPGSSFDPTGMVITASYANGGTQAVTGYSLLDGSNLANGKTTVTVSYSENGVTKTCSVNITVARAVPKLASAISWYRGNTPKESITSLTFTDSYTRTGSETEYWDASEAQDGSVMAYVSGTALVVAGNGSGCIKANESSQSAFSLYAQVTNGYSIVVNGSSVFTSFKSSLASISGLNLLDTSSVTDMSYMFYGDNMLGSIDLSRFNTSNVTDMRDMFLGCFNLSSIDCSSFDTSRVNNMKWMFQDCISAQTIRTSGFNTSNVSDMSSMFSGCKSLLSAEVSGFDTSNVTSFSNMFYDCINMTSVNVSGFNTTSAKDMSYMFAHCGKLTSLDVRSFFTSNVTTVAGMFSECSGLTSIDVTRFDTSRVTNMSSVFSGCTGLTSINISTWNTANVTTVMALFQNCSSLTSLDVSTMNTSNVTDMTQMFGNCTYLTTLNLGRWDTSRVTKMYNMFVYCTSLQTLDLSSWNTYSVTDMDRMFTYCTSLTTIYVGNGWSTVNVKEQTYLYFERKMFEGCYSLRGAMSYNASCIDKAYANYTDGYLTYKAA